MFKKTLFLALFSTILFFSQAAYSAYQEVSVKGGGSVKGKVTFKGELPDFAVERIAITKNPDVCGTGEREVVWVDVKDNALRGVVVFIDGIRKGKPWPKPEGGKYIIDQKGCRFHPWMQVIRQGDFIVRNSDKGVLHNIHTREMIGVGKRRKPVRRTIFNFGQPDPGDIVKKLKTRRSPFISVNCEAHNFMFAWMFAPKHPYAVVVGEDGSFKIDNIPPGQYTVKAWHPRLGLKDAKVTIPAKGTAEVNFEFAK